MNVYEEAHNLARAIKDSNEFKEYDEKRKLMEADDDSNNMIKELQSLQLQIQAKQLAGEQADPDMVQRMQSLYTMVMTKPLATDYLQAEARFSIMMKDVYEILADVVKLQF